MNVETWKINTSYIVYNSERYLCVFVFDWCVCLDIIWIHIGYPVCVNEIYIKIVIRVRAILIIIIYVWGISLAISSKLDNFIISWIGLAYNNLKSCCLCNCIIDIFYLYLLFIRSKILCPTWQIWKAVIWSYVSYKRIYLSVAKWYGFHRYCISSGLKYFQALSVLCNMLSFEYWEISFWIYKV